MSATQKKFSLFPVDAAVGKLTLPLMEILAGRVSRKEFFSELSQLLLRHFHFDRLCINLYDNNDGMLSFFTSAEGLIISTLSPVRPAEEGSTVAGYVIAARRAVVITDFSKHFPLPHAQPFEEAGLKGTIAIPLFLGSEIIGTFHCSFADPPANIQEIFHFLAPLCKVIAPCLGSILSVEQKIVLPQLPSSYQSSDTITHKSARMKDLIREVNSVAAYDIPVMLLGETGTGKSMFARYIHRHSKRSKSNFVKVNCPALSSSLFESELFGHSKGAFTGAFAKRIGRVELAHQGTLFLDEIGDLSLEMQSKLLQVIEDSRFERVGESSSLAVDIRLVSATNALVEQSMASKIMRSDLFHRLSAYVIDIPPLRERKEDIPVYIKTFALEMKTTLGIKATEIDKRHARMLMDYNWPGNLRELKNIVSRLLLLRQMGKSVNASTLSSMLNKTPHQKEEGERQRLTARSESATTGKTEKRFWKGTGAAQPLEQIERDYILEALENTKWVVSGDRGAATLLGLSRSQLLSKMRKLKIQHRPT